MQVHALSIVQIENNPLPGRSAVICMADSREQLARIKDTANVAARLDLIFNDTIDEFIGVRPPNAEDARKILAFVNGNREMPHLVIQCQVGVGRSMAALAAIARINGGDDKGILANGTYNRRLYRELLAAAGVAREPEPLVSIAVRIKYAPDRLKLFILSMQRQRHENWELVAVTDGPNEAAARLVADTNDPRIRFIETERRLGRWGHPYRQRGLDACRGDYIGMSNDDNYYVPGYIEQMLNAMGSTTDVVLCQALHSYAGWSVVPAGTDLGAWIARASLVRRVPWVGQDFTSDRDYLGSIMALAPGRVATVARPLFIHN
jgi:glycosyl transferase family 2